MNKTSLQVGCRHCRDTPELDFDFSFAFQPIFDIRFGTAFSYEALVRGPNGEGATSILSKVNDDNRYQFDQMCRVKAVTLAKQLGLECYLNINFLPNAVYQPDACIRTTINAADKVGLAVERIIFEVVESEELTGEEHLKSIIEHYKSRGIGTAIDDFGAGYANLNMLASFQPNYLKLDMKLVRDIHRNPNKRIIVDGVVAIAKRMNVTLIAEGVEVIEEAQELKDAGISLMQGFFFAKPAFETLTLAEAGSIEAIKF